jgi:hypothetical protein
MNLHDFFFYGYQIFGTMFVLGVATIVLETGDDDDDDRDGGILQPCYSTQQ